MRLQLAGMYIASAALAMGQGLVAPARLPSITPYFETRRDESKVRCEVDPIPPQLNFSFRFQSGYVVRLPMSQYFGAGHRLRILAKVTPEGSANPAYLANFLRLPNIPKTNRQMELAGLFMVGEGRYDVDFVLADDQGRTCRKNWRAEARLDSSERGLKPRIPPGTVAEATFRRWSPQDNEGEDTPLRRLTVLLHAAPLIPNSNRFRPQDRVLLLGSLASLLESIPARKVRLVVFNADQQKELFRQDDLLPESFSQVADEMNNLQLQLVNYHVLEKQRGHIDLLAALVNQELQAEEAPDAVIFFGPPTRYFDKLPQAALDEPGGAAPPFFYFEYRPYWRRAAEIPDSIAAAVRKLKGKTLMIHTPADFAKAIKQTEAQLVSRK